MTNIQYTIGSILCALCLYSCQPKMDDATPKTQKFCLNSVFKNKIEIDTVRIEQIMNATQLTGSVEANPDKVIEYVSLLNGVVTNVYFSIGDQVTKGQILAELKSSELSTMHAEISTVNAQINTTQRKVQSIQSMYNDGIATEKDLTEAQNELEILKSEKTKVAANMDLFSANTSKGVVQIKAPATGIVITKKIAPGMQITGENHSLFTIASLDNVWILANVYATNIATILPGMEAQITTISYPDETFHGSITSIPSVMDEEEKVLKARIDLPNAALKLKPGMHVDVRVLSKQEKTAVTIPTKALVFSENETFVLVYKNDCAIEARKVTIREKINGKVYINDGLTEGEKIITKNPLIIFEQIRNSENQ